MTNLINKIIIGFLALINRTILSPLRAKKEFTPVFERLFLMGIYGMNHARLGDPIVSGEAATLRKLLEKYRNAENFTLIDIGAHHGEYTDIVKDIIPDGSLRAYCVEPSNSCCSVLRKKYADNASISIHELAIGGHDGHSRIHNSGSKMAYVEAVDETGEEIHKGEVITIQTLRTFAAEQKILQCDLLKIDAEGSEYAILSSDWKYIAHTLKPHFIQFEFGYNNTLLGERVHFRQFVELLSPSYEIFKVTKNGLAALPKEIRMQEIYYSANYIAVAR